MLNLALVVVPVGDVCGSEESLTGFFFALDACDLEEMLGRVVQEPCQVGGFARPFACEHTGGLIVVTQLKGVLIGAGPAGPVRRDQQLPKPDAQWLEVEAPSQQIKVVHEQPLLHGGKRIRPHAGARGREAFA